MVDLGINYQSDLHVPSYRTVVDRDFFNRRFKKLHDALQTLNAAMTSYGAAEATLVQLGLVRMNETLSPLLVTLQDAANMGFQTVKSIGDAHSLVLGEFIGWQLTDGVDLFAPTPYLLAQDDDDSTNWGILSLDEGGFTRQTGELATHVVYASKTASSLNWTITTNNAVIPVAVNAMTAAIAAKNDAEAALATISANMVTIEGLIAAVEEGPVASVNGHTGAVVLATADIVGLTAALAAKASTASITSKQDASAKLQALVDLGWAANVLIYATGAGSLGTLPLSAFSRELLGDVDASARLTHLGISAYIKTLLDDVDASAAQSTLGISAFAKTLLDDADAAALRTTISTLPRAPAILTIADAASQPFDAQLGLTSVVRQSATANRTLISPTNPVDGQKVIIEFFASGAARTLTLTVGVAGAFRFGTDVTALSATTSGKTDRIGIIYNAAATRWDVVAYVKGY